MSDSDPVLKLTKQLNRPPRAKRLPKDISATKVKISKAEKQQTPTKKLRFLNRKEGALDDARGKSGASSSSGAITFGNIIDDDLGDTSNEDDDERYSSYAASRTEPQTSPYGESEEEDEEEEEDSSDEKEAEPSAKPKQNFSFDERKGTAAGTVEAELPPYTSSDEEDSNDRREDFRDEGDLEERTSRDYASWATKTNDSEEDAEEESEFTSFVLSDTKRDRSPLHHSYLEEMERNGFEDQVFIKSETKNPTHSAVEMQVLAGLSSISKSAQNENDPTHNETYQWLMNRASEEMHAHHNNLIRSYKHKPEEEKIIDALSELLRRFSEVVREKRHQKELAALSSTLFAHVEDPYSKEVLEAILKMQETIREVIKHSAEPEILPYYIWADRLALRWLVQRDLHGLKMERRRRMIEHATELRESEQTRHALREARALEKRARTVGPHPSHSLHYFRSILNFGM